MTLSSTKGVLLVLGRLLMIGLLIYIAISLVQHLDEMPRIELNTATICSLSLAVMSSVLVNGIGTLAWGWLIAAGAHDEARMERSRAGAPQRVQYLIVFRIWAISNVAKYLP